MPLARPISMHDFPIGSHGITFRRDAVTRGFTDNQLARAVSDKELARIWPGAFVPVGALPSVPEDLHRLRSAAAAELCGGDFALSHESAALRHTLSLLNPRLDRVHFVTGFRTGGRIEKQRHLHSGLLDPADVTVIDGLAVPTFAMAASCRWCGNGSSVRGSARDQRGLHPETARSLRWPGRTRPRRSRPARRTGCCRAGSRRRLRRAVRRGCPARRCARPPSRR
ncbi:hypothetical protein D7316_03067 [Gordonia insulae]|uniref:AbiEi antitoxin C-terminal domain-containing protein n=1 Tax=Gordonia insulae TaxID=2420509 RepID=A0A3G8JMZ7_9ACTN|nr:hypothetical protein D7316_03067 [Gordonia insulae]